MPPARCRTGPGGSARDGAAAGRAPTGPPAPSGSPRTRTAACCRAARSAPPRPPTPTRAASVRPPSLGGVRRDSAPDLRGSVDEVDDGGAATAGGPQVEGELGALPRL